MPSIPAHCRMAVHWQMCETSSLPRETREPGPRCFSPYHRNPHQRETLDEHTRQSTPAYGAIQATCFTPGRKVAVTVFIDNIITFLPSPPVSHRRLLLRSKRLGTLGPVLHTSLYLSWLICIIPIRNKWSTHFCWLNIWKPGKVLRMLRGNPGAYSVRSPRCSQTLWLQSQRTAGGEMRGCRCPDSGLVWRFEDRIHDIWQLTLKMVPGGNG